MNQNLRFSIPRSALRTPHCVRVSSAFTLIEMLVVIGIIATLAALIAVGAAGVMHKGRVARVQTELKGLETVIETYKSKKGFYPPDNTNSAVQNPLFYELTGTSVVISNATPYFASSISHDMLSPAQVPTLFNMGGFVNASADTNEFQNYFGRADLKAQAYALITNGPPPPPPYALLGIAGLKGPVELRGPATVISLNPWRYVSSNPTNNPGSYDLWMDFVSQGKTNRVSNWSKDPQIVY
jgi:prepilin-type N-terminal cleavage/methylation domain-containing protein